ncbi:hypothetical protein JCM8115_001086 [Rhodotorula mucilaginosa]
MSTGLSLTDLEQAFGNWDDAPLSFEDLPPAAQPRKNAPSRSSTGFSALTMHSSDDPPLEFSDIDSLASEQLEMDIETFLDEDDFTSADESHSSTAEEDAVQTDEELPDLAFSSDEEDSWPDATLATPRRDLPTAKDDGLDDLGQGDPRFGRGRNPISDDGLLSFDHLDDLHPDSKPAPLDESDDEMLGHEDQLSTKKPPRCPRPRKRLKTLHSDSIQNETAEESPGLDAGRARDHPTNSRPRSPTQAEMDAFFGFVAAPAIQIDPQLLNMQVTPTWAGGDAAATEQAATQGERTTPEDRRADFGQEIRAWQRDKSTAQNATTDKKEASPRPYYQLERIPTVSASSGRPLTVAEKSLHIRTAFERIALSILQQIADNVLPPIQTEAAGSDRESTSDDRGQASAVPNAKALVVVLAKRGGKDRSVSKEQRIKYPHKVGKGEGVRLGARELAIFLRVVQLLLDGLKLGVVSTKRDLYYRDVQLFRKQQVVDAMIDDIAATLGVRRSDLNVVATSKGLFSGALRLVSQDGSALDGTEQGALIPPSQKIAWIELDQVRWILIVEKDAVFSTLNDAGLTSDGELGNGILITGKGYPDVVTRELVVRLATAAPDIPIFALVDCDPHGLEILSTYCFGLRALAHEADQLAAPDIQWLGLKLDDAGKEGIGRDKLLPLKSTDRLKAHALLKRDGVPDDWKRELQQMLRLGCKAETEILSEKIPATVSSENDPQAAWSSSGVVHFVKRQLELALAVKR